MAIVEKVTLIDDYSAKAEKIASSSSKMSSAMDKIGGVASKMGSALKSAFSNKLKPIEIKEVGSQEVRSKLRGLQVDLDSIANGKYKVNIKADTRETVSAMDKLRSGFDKVKSGIGGIGPKFKSIGSNIKGWAINKKDFMSAKLEARKLSKELTKMTGKKHKVKIDLDKPDTGGFLNNLKSGFSKIRPSKLFGRNRAVGVGGSEDSSAGGGLGGSMLKSIVGGNLITGAITKGIGAITNTFQSTVGAGFDRLTSIESAQARLRGFGYNQKDVKAISNSAMEAVTGTQYSMSDAMTASAGAIAAGMEKSQLTDYLKEVGNAAAATGSDFNEIASIMNKVKTTGHLQADEMRQLSDRGLPVLAKLAEQAGVSVDEMSKRISKGNVSFDQFRSAVKSASGTAAEEVAKTWGGAKDNFKSALGKLGAGLLGGNDTEDGSQGGIFGLMTPALLKANEVLNSLVPKFKDAGDAIKNFVTNGFEKAKSGFSKIKEVFSQVADVVSPLIEKAKAQFKSVFDRISEVIGPLKEKFTSAFNGLKEAFAPLKDAVKGFFEGTDTDFDLSSVVDIVADTLSFFADVIKAVTPIIESAVDIISTYVIPVVSKVAGVMADLGGWILENVIPAIISLADWILTHLSPAIEATASFITDTVMPTLSDIATYISGVVTDAFNMVVDAVNWAKGAFDNLVGAVQTAGDFLAGLPGRISGWVSDKVDGAIGKAKGFLGIGKNATGTSYFEGGMTKVNERGEELIQLARGDKIYPSQKTDRIIKKEVSNENNVSKTNNVNPIVNINVYGNNKEQDIARAVTKEFKRLGVVV